MTTVPIKIEGKDKEYKRINISMDAELHKKMKIAIVEQDTTITQFVIDAIREKIDRETD